MKFTHVDADRNSQSAIKLPHVVTKKIDQEVASGRISGPYATSPYEQFVVSPLGIREKKVPGTYRVIHDLSYPYNSESVNANIPRECASVQYSSIVDAIRNINIFGPGCYLAKSDIKSAFRIIPIHPSDRHMLGFKWLENYYFDNCLPMGCSSSCSIFEMFSTALEWIIVQNTTKVKIVHVLDDFLFVAENFEDCQKALNIFLEICQIIGVPIAPEKTIGPVQSLPFVGIDLDTIAMTANLPQDKVDKFLTQVEFCLSNKAITVSQLQSTCGMLNFACGVIPSARAFTRRLYDLSIGKSKPYYRVKMTREVKQDLQVWRMFLNQYNYRTLLLDYKWISNQHLRLFTDASTTIGYGGVFGDKWFYGLWSDSCRGMNIALLELYPICLALHLWTEQLVNKCITIHSDNQAVVHIINNSTSKDANIMILVRKFTLLCMQNNILIRATHIPGKINITPDLLSRDQVQKAKQHSPNLEEEPQLIPFQWMLKTWLGI